MFERFTDRSRRAVVLAQEEARMLDHAYIGTEHTLLGLLHEGEGIAAQVLTELGFTLVTAREFVEEIVGRGSQPFSGHLPYTPSNKKVLELALREALQLGHNHIGTEHLLLGLTRHGEGVAAQVMEKLGSDSSAVRVAALTRMGKTNYDNRPVRVTLSGTRLDAELGAMQATLAALQPLDAATRARVLAWVSARLDE
jgi:ATP-dependent Clp protease ATP-binding subunit ClpA